MAVLKPPPHHSYLPPSPSLAPNTEEPWHPAMGTPMLCAPLLLPDTLSHRGVVPPGPEGCQSCVPKKSGLRPLGDGGRGRAVRQWGGGGCGTIVGIEMVNPLIFRNTIHRTKQKRKRDTSFVIRCIVRVRFFNYLTKFYSPFIKLPPPSCRDCHPPTHHPGSCGGWLLAHPMSLHHGDRTRRLRGSFLLASSFCTQAQHHPGGGRWTGVGLLVPLLPLLGEACQGEGDGSWPAPTAMGGWDGHRASCNHRRVQVGRDFKDQLRKKRMVKVERKMER